MVFATTFPHAVRRFSALPTRRAVPPSTPDTSAHNHQRQHKAVTVEQDDTSTTLRFDVPGVSREQLTIGIEGPIVRIESVAGAPRQYQMAYRLAQQIAADTSSAKLENGVLTVKLAKPVPVDRSTRIAVH